MGLPEAKRPMQGRQEKTILRDYGERILPAPPSSRTHVFLPLPFRRGEAWREGFLFADVVVLTRFGRVRALSEVRPDLIRLDNKVSVKNDSLLRPKGSE
jgi:hypothetical protein